jgi:CheY-like chemotaxis protein
MKTILLIDDDLATLEVINECLRPHFRTRIATRGGKGMELAQPVAGARPGAARPRTARHERLPGLLGAQARRTRTADIPVIFLSSHSISPTSPAASNSAPSITCPNRWRHRSCWRACAPNLRLREAQIHLADRNLHLESLVQRTYARSRGENAGSAAQPGTDDRRPRRRSPKPATTKPATISAARAPTSGRWSKSCNSPRSGIACHSKNGH